MFAISEHTKELLRSDALGAVLVRSAGFGAAWPRSAGHGAIFYSLLLHDSSDTDKRRYPAPHLLMGEYICYQFTV